MKIEWADSLVKELGLRSVKIDQVGVNRGALHVPCSTCDHNFEMTLLKRLPPEVIKKKLIERGWTLRKGRLRCKACSSPQKDLSDQLGVNDMLFPRIGQNDTNVHLRIPPKTDLYNELIDENGHPRFMLSFEYGDKQLIVCKHPVPTDVKRVKGQARGTIVSADQTYFVQISHSQVPGSERMKNFSPDRVELIKEEGNYMVFSLPKEATLKPMNAPVDKKLKKEKVEPVKDEVPEEPVKVEAEPTPPPPPVQTAPPVQSAPEPKKTGADILREGANPFGGHLKFSDKSIFHAIELLNAYKDIMGSKIEYSINSSGHISAIAQFGRE